MENASRDARDMDGFEITAHADVTTSPLVSAIVITYNHRSYIEQCLDSIAAQACSFPFEIIIADDCSTDGTTQICKDFQAAHPDKVRLLSGKRNVGGQRNFLRALMASRGKYVAICEGDDFWLSPDKLARQCKVLEERVDLDLCFSAARSLRDDGQTTRMWDYGPLEKHMDLKTLYDRAGSVAPTASLLMRADAIKQVPACITNAPVGDLFYTFLSARRGGAIYLPEELACYRVLSIGSHSALWAERSTDNIFQEFLSTTQTLSEMCRQLSVDEKIFGYYQGHRHAFLAREFLRRGNPMAAFQHFRALPPRYLFDRMSEKFAKRQLRSTSAL